MARASYFRRQAKSSLFSRSVGGKYYAEEPASWRGLLRGQAPFLEFGVGDMRWCGDLGGPHTCVHFLLLLSGNFGLVLQAEQQREVVRAGRRGRIGGRGGVPPLCEAPCWRNIRPGSVLALPSTSCVTLGPHASEPQFSMHHWGITVIRRVGLSALNEVIHVKCLLVYSILDVHDDCWRQGGEPSSIPFPEPTHPAASSAVLSKGSGPIS